MGKNFAQPFSILVHQLHSIGIDWEYLRLMYKGFTKFLLNNLKTFPEYEISMKFLFENFLRVSVKL